jgi:preprotein translocase subunit Sss1
MGIGSSKTVDANSPLRGLIEPLTKQIPISAKQKGWSMFYKILMICLIGIMLAVTGGFSAKSAAELNQLSNFKNLKDPKSPDYSEHLDKAHSFMAGSASIGWIGFAALVVLIIILSVTATGWGAKLATNAVANVASKVKDMESEDITEINKCISNFNDGSDPSCINDTADEIVNSGASSARLFLMLISLGVAVFIGFVGSLSIRGYWHASKFRKSAALSAADAALVADAMKKSLITSVVTAVGVMVGLFSMM